MKNRHMEIINCSIKNKMACTFAWGRDTFGWGVSSSWKYGALAAKVNTSIFKTLSESHAKDVRSLTATLQQQHLHFLCPKHFPRFSFALFFHILPTIVSSSEYCSQHFMTGTADIVFEDEGSETAMGNLCKASAFFS